MTIPPPAHTDQQGCALRDFDQAFHRIRPVGEPLANDEEKCVLQALVDSARDAGVTWSSIGDVLGLARGNAYQRYRRRPDYPCSLRASAPVSPASKSSSLLERPT